MVKHLDKKGLSWAQQAKEGLNNIKDRYLTETDFIKTELNKTGDRMGRMEQDHKPPIYSLIR